MKDSTKDKLYAAWAWCDEEDKSTGFMIQFMADEAGIEPHRVVDFIGSDKANQERNEWYEKHPRWDDEWKLNHILCPECGEATLMPEPNDVNADHYTLTCPECNSQFEGKAEREEESESSK